MTKALIEARIVIACGKLGKPPCLEHEVLKKQDIIKDYRIHFILEKNIESEWN